MITKPTNSPFSKEVPGLLNSHLEHLKASAVSIDVIKERGYKTILGKKELKDAGFSKAQQRAPGILIPLYGPDGTAVGFQYRPDHPREKENGKFIKYENPVGSMVRLDVPPRCRPAIADPSAELWFTEGVKKADALATVGACAVCLTGVWGFKGKNPYGSSTVLADFDYIALEGRHCYLVFDSDLATNPSVRHALDRLEEHLNRKGAMVSRIFLPPGPNGEKIGADDYLAGGHSLEDIKALVNREPPPVPPKIKRFPTQYDIVDGIICWVKNTSEGISEIPLCNFNARVTEDISRDNGVETTRFLKIEGALPGNKALPVIEVSASEFTNLSWVASKWGVRAIIAAGQNAKDRLREAIQLQSKEALSRMVYTHTGWREIDGEMYFLTGSGALGRDDIEVELEPDLQNYQLLPATGDAADAIKKSLDFCLVAPPETTFPLWAAMYLAPLTEFIDTSFTVFLVGSSGSYKSTMTALALSHFGTFDAKHLPAAWRASQNALEYLLFSCKDIPLVIDDWAPGQDTNKARDLEVKAEYIIRAQGNRQARQRMKPDTTMRAAYIPRGLLVTSGEQLPSGHSHTARIFSIEIERSEVDIAYLGTAQGETVSYCRAMAYYITWLKSSFGKLKQALRKRWNEYRDKVLNESSHPRMAEDIASLYIAAELTMEFAQEYHAITDSLAKEFKEQAWDIFCTLAARQAGRIEEERPSHRAMAILNTMVDQGIAVFLNRDDMSPKTPAPGIRHVGWFENRNGTGPIFYLNPIAAHAAIVEYSQKTGNPFTIKPDALWQDLKRMGYSECDEGRVSKVIKVYGKAVRVIMLKKSQALIYFSGNCGNCGNDDDI